MDLFTKDWGECVVAGVATLRCIWPLFNNVVNASIILSGVVALYFIIMGGIKYITSRGDPEAIEGARKTITFALIGLVFIIFSFVIFNFFLYDLIGIKNEGISYPAPTPGATP